MNQQIWERHGSFAFISPVKVPLWDLSWKQLAISFDNNYYVSWIFKNYSESNVNKWGVFDQLNCFDPIQAEQIELLLSLFLLFSLRHSNFKCHFRQYALRFLLHRLSFQLLFLLIHNAQVIILLFRYLQSNTTQNNIFLNVCLPYNFTYSSFFCLTSELN